MQKIFDESKDVYDQPHSFTALGAVRPTAGRLKLLVYAIAHFDAAHHVLVIDLGQRLKFETDNDDGSWRFVCTVPEGFAKLPDHHRVLKTVDGLGAAARVTLAIVDEYYATAKHWAENTRIAVKITDRKAA